MKPDSMASAERASAGAQSRSPAIATPILKWAGGKRWLTGHIGRLVRHSFRTYYEPFLGSGAVYFYLCPPAAQLSDTNARLIDMYAAIRADWKAVWKALERHAAKHSRGYYYQVRQRRYRRDDLRAAQFIYLNRTCWNGLYRVNRQGVFNVPKGTKDEVLLPSDNFGLIAALLGKASLANSDFESQIDRAGKGDLVFADPPYTVRHNRNGFIKYNKTLFAWDDQLRLHSALSRAAKRGAHIICTNANHQSIRTLYRSDFHLETAKRFSSIAGDGEKRGQYSELIITST